MHKHPQQYSLGASDTHSLHRVKKIRTPLPTSEFGRPPMPICYRSKVERESGWNDYTEHVCSLWAILRRRGPANAATLRDMTDVPTEQVQQCQ